MNLFLQEATVKVGIHNVNSSYERDYLRAAAEVSTRHCSSREGKAKNQEGRRAGKRAQDEP